MILQFKGDIMKNAFLQIFTLIILLTASAFSQNAADPQPMDSHHLAPAIGKSGENPTASDSVQQDLNDLNFRLANGFNSYLSRYALDHDYAVRGIDNYAALQPGVIRQDNLIYMFGSEYYQTGYYLNGINVNSLYTGKSGIYIIPEALERLRVGSLPYRSDFGGASGGMIDARMRTGGEELQAAVLYRTDGFAGEGKQFLNTYSYGYQSTVAMLSGPLVTPRIRFFLAGEFNPIRDRARRFVEGFTMDNLLNIMMYPSVDTLNINYRDGNTPANKQERLAFNGNLIYDFSPLSGRIDFTYLKNRDHLNETPIISYFNERKAYNDEYSYFLNGSLDYAFNSQGRAELHYSTYNSFVERKDDLFGSDYLAWYDSTANAAKGINYPGRYRAPQDYMINGVQFQGPGAPYENQYFKSKLEFKEISGNLYYKFSNLLNLQVGMTDRRYKQRYFSIEPDVISVYSMYPEAEGPQDIPASIWGLYGNYSSYGYDLYGGEISKDAWDGPFKPRSTAWYLQDKIDLGRFHVTAGLRYETIDPGYWYLKDFIFDPQSGQITDYSFARKASEKRFLPRIGLSYRPSAFVKLNAGYGKYLQISPNLIAELEPTLLELPGRIYRFSNAFETNQTGVGALFGPCSAGELNLQLMVRSSKIIGDDLPVHSDILGATFRSRRLYGLQATLHYTYTNTVIKSKNPYGYETTGKAPYVQAHRGAFLLDYHFDGRKTKSIFRKSGLGIAYSFNSGHYFNKVDGSYLGQSDPYLGGNIDESGSTRVVYKRWQHNPLVPQFRCEII